MDPRFGFKCSTDSRALSSPPLRRWTAQREWDKPFVFASIVGLADGDGRQVAEEEGDGIVEKMG
jgi:hypothetical protein